MPENTRNVSTRVALKTIISNAINLMKLGKTWPGGIKFTVDRWKKKRNCYNFTKSGKESMERISIVHCS